MERLLRDQPAIKKREISLLEWISGGTWSLVNKRAGLWRQKKWMGVDITNQLRNVNVDIRRRLKLDRYRRAETVGLEIEAFLAGENVRGVWERLKAWYHTSSGIPPRPSNVDLDQETENLKDLYSDRDLMLPSFDTRYKLPHCFCISDTIPEPQEIFEAAKKLKRRKETVPSKLRVDTLTDWSSECWNIT